MVRIGKNSGAAVYGSAGNCAGALLVGVAVAALLSAGAAHAQEANPRFFHDDPLQAELSPAPTLDPQPRALSDILELVSNVFGNPGERHPDEGVIEARGVNTLGEVLDGAWFVNRHASRRLSRAELRAGPGADHPPDLAGPWRVLTLRPFGVRPGILVADARDHLYLLILDPPDNPELLTGAQMVSSRIAHAIGYHVPESHLVWFERSRLVLGEGAEIVSSAGNTRELVEEDIDWFLRTVPPSRNGRFRAVALYVSPPDWRGLIGPYRMVATRGDDPNDVIPHEHRRDLRGLWVVSAWINHSTIRAVSTEDVLVEENGVPFIRHYIFDHFASLGSGYNEVKRSHEGNDPFFDRRAALRNIVGFGIWSPRWMRARFPRLPAVGRFEAQAFRPDRWTTTEGLAPFENRLPDDVYWGAKQVIAFTDDDIRTIVESGEYSDPQASEWIANTLIQRRDRIGRSLLGVVLPLDNFTIERDVLRFDDLARTHGYTEELRTYVAEWFLLDNANGRHDAVPAETTLRIPDELASLEPGRYFGVRLRAEGEDPERHVTVYLRASDGDPAVVGVERGWPGKVIADPRLSDPQVSRHASLTPDQQALYGPYAESDAKLRGRTLTVQEHFDQQTISERTTYEAVTHALLNSPLSDENGNDLGSVFSLIQSLDRVAGQYFGRAGDQQFRLYVELVPDATDRLQRATEFFEDRPNTVYHLGYPISFRQVGRVPNLQVSVSDDGRRSDIDVDYRSSRSPQALFNGHLTSSNSDVRAGDNAERHSRRWAGFIAWWRDVFGGLTSEREGPTGLIAAADREIPTQLPDDRPTGSPIANPEDAAQEFLTDWLIRRDVDAALEFLSERAYACLNLDDMVGNEAVATAGARDALRDIMELALDELERFQDLTEAIDTVAPFDPDRELLSHPFGGEFAIGELSLDEASEYLCGQSVRQLDWRDYHGVFFRFKDRAGGAMSLLWGRATDGWRLISYRVFEM